MEKQLVKARSSLRAHNRQLWRPSKMRPRNPLILVEHSAFFPAVAFSYVSNVLADEHEAKISAYSASPSAPTFVPFWFYRTVSFVAFALNVAPKSSIAKSFGVSSKLVMPSRARRLREKAEKICVDFYSLQPSKTDLEKLKVNGVLVGDLIYDTYLRQNRSPLIEVQSEEFRKFLAVSVTDFLFWFDLIEGERVAALVVSHSCFLYAMPLRVALLRGIPAYAASDTYLYRLSESRQHTHLEFLDYPEIFSALEPEKQSDILREAKDTLDRRFRGETTPSSDISKASVFLYRPSASKKIMRVSSRPKIVIAAHALYEGPHVGGAMLFPDFLEWMNYLGHLSAELPYDWYLKNHPDSYHGDAPFLAMYVEQFPQISILPDDASHHQLIQEGISAVATARGTIGFEYALHGVPVINASPVNPHIRYPFNYHPESIEELDALFRSIETLRKPSKRDQQLALEYFATKHHLSKRRFLREGVPDVPLPEPGLYDPKRDNPGIEAAMLQTFLSSWDNSKHTRFIKTITKFVRSGDYTIL